jgi:hypothetical protein
MTRSWATELSAVIGDNRWSPERIAALADDELDLYPQILQRFAEGRPPRPAEPEASPPDAALGRLVARDLVQLDPGGDVAVAYPFSAHPTRHRVRLGDGRCYWACCAIDALGIPYLLGERAVVDAREPDGGRPITVVVDPDAGTLRCDPPDATVVVAASGDGCAAACACPHINLLGSRGAAERYLARPRLQGTILDVAEAAAAGRALFGDLGHLLTTRLDGPDGDRADSGSGTR